MTIRDRIGWKVTGEGPFRAAAFHPKGTWLEPAWSPELHGSSNWNLRSLIYISVALTGHRPSVSVKPPQLLIRGLAFIGRCVGFTLE